MSEERRRMDKQATGTVPKSKGRNNTPYTNERDSPRSWTTNNNLTSDLQHRLNLSEFLRAGNSRRNLPSHHNYCMMNSTVEEPQQGRFNTSVSTSSMTPNTSSSNSRRNSTSTVPKCDNVTKYPDKMQIEDKLSQIREYLQITNSLMSSIKNTDDQSEEVAAEKDNLVQMIADLKDSETKLVDILEGLEMCQNQFPIIENPVDINSEASHRNEPDEMTIASLQQKAENKLRDARSVQDKLLAGQYGNDLNSSNRRDKNLQSMQDYDMAILELEERTKRLKEPRRGSDAKLQDKLLAEVDNLQSQIITLHNVNEDRTELIQVLDNRDAELRAQHMELQGKLSELQNRKLQVDQIVSQLQNLDEAEEDDVGSQVRKIVTMKDQLAKLKDMLEIVKTTESVVTNGTATQEEQELACEICTKAENFLQKADGGGNGGEKCKPAAPPPPPQVQNEIRYDNTGILNENRNKQVNKNSVPGDGYGGAKPRSSNYNKLALQAELEAKKRELEEIMGKHKASTSNLNHDVGNDTKSEFSCSSNAFFDSGAHGWVPLMADHNRFDSASESDGCPEDVNEYSDLNSATHHHNDCFTLPLMNYPQDRKHCGKQQTTIEPEYVHALASDRHSTTTRTPERSMRSNSATSANYTRERPRANSDQGNSKNQVQKQLELIRSVCDSMLEQQQQQANNQQPSNVQQLRNNLTPSPQYSEPRRFSSAQSPNPHSMNALNVVNPLADVASAWSPCNNNNQPTDGAGHQQAAAATAGWLATNTLQTQAFMINTLNQCCQMLWLQQRELMSLRQNVAQLQERIDNNPAESSSQLASPMVPTPVGDPPRSSRSNQQQKANQVSAACSMPNLNQYNVLPPPHQSLAAAAAANNARLLDASCLNNANLNLNPIDNVNNGVLHGVNAANINQMHQQPSHHHAQMWNGQALNNQVAPGNRANNYWDNFRSYSRQNLLSTKSNEGFQNVVSSSSCSSNGLERSNVTERTNPFALMSLAKSNSDHHHASSSFGGNASENTHRSASQFVPIRHSATDTQRNNVCVVPPDVLNINHNATAKVQEQPPTPIDLPHLSNTHARNVAATNSEHETTTTTTAAAELCYQTYLNNVFGYNENSSNNSNISEDHIFKDCIPETTRRRNEWHEEPIEEPYPKSKLFEELRDNVYKEVVSLISANEARPHFLIQLFRDLQMISSDPLRLKILQCIQTIITHSLMSSTSLNRPVLESQTNEQVAPPDGFSLQSTVWSKAPPKNPRSLLHVENENSSDVQNPTREIIPFLNDHEDDIFSHHFLVGLRQMVIESETFREIIKDTVFKKHFSNVLDEVLGQFHGKKIRDVKMHIIQTINDLIRGELSFIQLIQETCPSATCDSGVSSTSTSHSNHNNSIFDLHHIQQQQQQQQSSAALSNVTVNGQIVDSSTGCPQLPVQIQNGDLAEADQSRVDEDEVEEEGAVGFWDLGNAPVTHPPQQLLSNPGGHPAVNEEAVEISTVEYQNNTESQTQFIKQGLDQVPTRLPTKSRSNTPQQK